MTMYEIMDRISSMSKDDKKSLINKQVTVLKKNKIKVVEASILTLSIIVPDYQLEDATALTIDECVTIGSYC